jgi:hypothetical protein
MQAKIIGNKPERLSIPVINTETAEIEVGVPVVFAANGTDDGVAVCLPASKTAAYADTLFAGIVVEKNLPIVLPKTGKAQVYGVCPTSRICRQTRAATTDSFSTAPAIAIGDIFLVNTVVNALSRSAAGAASQAPGRIHAFQTVASAAGVASNATDTRTLVTSNIKTFIRGC